MNDKGHILIRVNRKKKIKINQRVIRQCISGFSVICAYIIFEYLYVNDIFPQYEYLGYPYNLPSIKYHVISLTFALLPISFLPTRLKKPSDFGVILIYLFSYLPTAFMIRHKFRIESNILLLITLFIALVVMELYRKFDEFSPSRSRSRECVYPLKIPHSIRYLSIGLFSILILLFMWGNDFHFDLSLISEGERRLAARHLPFAFFGYLISLGQSLLTVYATYFFLVERRIIWIALLVLSSLAIFSFDGTKSTLLVPILLLLSFTVMKRYSLTVIYIFVVVLFVIALAELKFFHSNMIDNYLVRRIFSVPGLVNIIYWDFFSHHDKVFLTDSILKYLISPVYILSPQFLIGVKYFDDVTASVNTGIWMNWYAQFGFFGVIIVSILAGIVLSVVDTFTTGRHLLLGSLVCVYLGYIWAAQAFHTSFLSGGVLYLLLSLILFTRRGRLIKSSES